MEIETKCLHAGYEPKNGEPRMLPIVQSTTFKYDSSEEMGKLFDLKANGYFYSRLQNPTTDAVAAKIAADAFFPSFPLDVRKKLYIIQYCNRYKKKCGELRCRMTIRYRGYVL